MKYNTKYDRWFSEEGLVYRYDKKRDRLVLCKISKLSNGYCVCGSKGINYKVHRAIWETFNGPIPEGMVIDHQDTNKENNRLDNLKVCTHKENSNNPITLDRIRKTNLKNLNERPTSGFGKKFYEHFKLYRRDNLPLYEREIHYYSKHGHCRWEEE